MCKNERSIEEITVDLIKLTESLFYMIEDQSVFTDYELKELSEPNRTAKDSVSRAEREFIKLKQELTGE